VVDGVKTPNFIHLPDGELLVFAGLYEWWRNPAAADDAADKWLLSTTILTQDAAAELADIHDRMPVFLDPALIDEWLEPGADGTDELLGAVAAGGIELAHGIEFHEVDRAVGNVRNNSPQLVEPI
jgi:putative SOS response-associated peptidase YedK